MVAELSPEAVVEAVAEAVEAAAEAPPSQLEVMVGAEAAPSAALSALGRLASSHGHNEENRSFLGKTIQI